MTKKNPNIIAIPIIKYREVKNPSTLFPIDWERKYGKERVRYDEYPALDENGNIITKRDIYVVFEELKEFRFINKTKRNRSKQKKLFETYADIQKREMEEKINV